MGRKEMIELSLVDIEGLQFSMRESKVMQKKIGAKKQKQNTRNKDEPKPPPSPYTGNKNNKKKQNEEI